MFISSVLRKISRGTVAALLPLLLWSVTFTASTYSPGAAAQLACPADGSSICKSTSFCTGINAGTLSYSTMDRAFIDQMRGAAVSVAGFTPGDILRNSAISLDANKYPTVDGAEVQVLFYSPSATPGWRPGLPAGKYVVMWDGQATDPKMQGAVSNVVPGNNRIEFDLNPTLQQNTRFAYTNGASDHVTNIRIVPIAFEAAYANWSWSDYQIGAATNPPIFFPQWLAKMSNACTIRYMNARNSTDRDVITYKRDSTATRIKPSNSVWYDGFGLGSTANTAHVWPWELIVESSIQTDSRPWINFRVLAWDNVTTGNDTIISDVAKLFADNWGGIVYVEYGNEIWNTAFPFNVATNWVAFNGPDSSTNVNINYSLRNNDIQKWFADAYAPHTCKAVGVAATQGRVISRGQEILSVADKNYVDIISPTTYVGEDISPTASNGRWIWMEGIYDEVVAGTKTKEAAFDEIKQELLDGQQNQMIPKNWLNDIRPKTQLYIDLANQNDMCTAFYEGGLHLRVDDIDINNAKHVAVSEFVREYQQSQQQADLEKTVNDFLRDSGSTGPGLVYGSFISAGRGTFSYWDTVFDSPANYGKRVELLGAYGDGGGTARDGGTTDGGTDGSTDGTTDSGTDGTTDSGTDGTTDSGTDGTTDSGTDGTTDSGTDGTTDAGTDGTTDAGTDGTTDAGTDGTTDAGTDGTTDAGTDGTTDAGTDGTTDAGTDGTTDSGTDGTTDAGTDGTTDSGTDGTTDSGTDGTDGSTDGTSDGVADTDGGTDGQTDGDRRTRLYVMKRVRFAQRSVARLDNRFFRSARAKERFQTRLEELSDAIRSGQTELGEQIIKTLVVRVDGCGRKADANDTVTRCQQQNKIRRNLRASLLRLQRDG